MLYNLLFYKVGLNILIRDFSTSFPGISHKTTEIAKQIFIQCPQEKVVTFFCGYCDKSTLLYKTEAICYNYINHKGSLFTYVNCLLFCAALDCKTP